MRYGRKEGELTASSIERAGGARVGRRTVGLGVRVEHLLRTDRMMTYGPWNTHEEERKTVGKWICKSFESRKTHPRVVPAHITIPARGKIINTENLAQKIRSVRDTAYSSPQKSQTTPRTHERVAHTSIYNAVLDHLLARLRRLALVDLGRLVPVLGRYKPKLHLRVGQLGHAAVRRRIQSALTIVSNGGKRTV